VPAEVNDLLEFLALMRPRRAAARTTSARPVSQANTGEVLLEQNWNIVPRNAICG